MKIFFLVIIQICLLANKLFAQQCTSPPNCIADPHLDVPTDWYAAYGTLITSTNNVPPATTGSSLFLSSVLSQGNDAFTCYDFEAGNTYRVCFWVRNASGWPSNDFGRLYVYAAQNLVSGGNLGSAQAATKQLIDQSYCGPNYGNMSGYSPWVFVTATFTANAYYNNLLLYAVNPMGPPPPGNAQWATTYSVEVDDIRVEDITGITPTSFTITGNNTIDGCNTTGTGQTTLTIEQVTPTISSPMPSNYVATWDPIPYNYINANGNRSSVEARPCSTTTYKIEISDPSGSSCANCVRETLYYTVNVNQWSDPSNIIHPTTVVPCGDDLNLLLDYIDPGTCPGTTFNWIEPNGVTSHGGQSPTTILPAHALHTGEWTLQVFVPGKNCPEEHKFFITVGSCCISNPSFYFSGCNPVTFTNTSTGFSSHVGTLWSFGDGSTSGQLNPIHTYNVINNQGFEVCLTMLYEDDQGETCCERFCQDVEVCPKSCAVIADFTTSPVAGSIGEFDFTDASSFNGTVCDYLWEFGDGTLIHTTLPTIRHTYSAATPGPWWVCLTVTNCIYNAAGVEIERCSSKKCMWLYPVEGKRSAGDISEGDQPEPDMPGNGNSINEKGLTVYPNPNYGNFALSLDQQTGTYQVVVRDKLGREVYNREHVFTDAPVKIILKDVSDGIYSVEVVNENEKFVQQITITR